MPPGVRSPSKPSGPGDPLRDADFFAKKRYANAQDLLARLQDLHTLFRDMRQPPEGAAMPFNPKLPQALAHEHYLNHTLKDVQLLTSCILADVFRVNAPEHPFTAHQLRDIFDAWLRQFELLADQKEKGRALVAYLLEQTATVRSFLVLTDPQLETSAQTTRLFDLFLNRIAPGELEGGPAMVRHMEDILQAVLGEGDSVPPEVLDLLLNDLCGPSRRSKTHKFRLAKAVLEHGQAKLLPTIEQLLEGTLAEHFEAVRKYDSLPEYAKHRQDHLKAIGRTFEMVEELEFVHGAFLGARLRPFLEDECEDLRLMTVETVCNLFKARPRYCRSYARVLDSFLARCHDRSRRIRARMIAWCQDMMIEDDDFRSKRGALLHAALDDREDTLRRAAVTAVVEVARRHPRTVPRSLISALDQRLRTDRKPLVRRHCLQKLSGLYADLTAAWMGAGDPHDPARELCGWIPSAVLSCCEDRDPEIREAALHLIHTLLPPVGTKGKGAAEDAEAGVEIYARAFVELYRCLCPEGRPTKVNLLQPVLAGIAALRKLVAGFVEHRSAAKGDEGRDTKESEVGLAMLAERTGGTQGEWLELGKVRDEKVFRCLATLVDAAHPCGMEEAITLRDQVVAKVRAASKGEPLVTLITQVTARLVFPVAPEHVAAMVALGHAAKRDPSERALILGALATIAGPAPALFGSSVGTFTSLVLGETDEAVLSFGLLTLHRLGTLVPQDAPTQQRLTKRLRSWGIDSDVPTRKAALQCLSACVPGGAGAVVAADIAGEAVAQLSVGNRMTTTLLGALKACQWLFRLYPTAMAGHPKALKFIETEVLRYFTPTREAGGDWADPPYECRAWALGLKVLTAYLRTATTTPTIKPPDFPYYVKLVFALLRDLTQGAVASMSQSLKTAAIYTTTLGLLQTDARKSIQPVHLNLVMVANLLEGDERAREAMSAKAFRHLFTQKLPLKYSWLLVVNVLDPDKRLAAQARERVGRLVQRYRDQQRGLERSGRRMGLSDLQAPLVYPEYILPDLLYQLAHYPQFEQHHPFYEPMQVCFYVFFEAVTKDVDNVSFLYKLLQSIKRCNDAAQPGSKNHKILCDIAFDIAFNEYGKTRTSSGKAFPGTVNVPRIFQPVDRPEDDAVSYKPEAFRLLGKARALRSGPLPEGPSPAKEKEREAPAAKRKADDADSVRSQSPSNGKRRKLFPDGGTAARGGDGAREGDEDVAAEVEDDDYDHEVAPPPPATAKAKPKAKAKGPPPPKGPKPAAAPIPPSRPHRTRGAT